MKKVGRVIEKDFDFKENEYFKISTPLFNSELKENTEFNSNTNNNVLIKTNSLTNINKNENSV